MAAAFIHNYANEDMAPFLREFALSSIRHWRSLALRSADNLVSCTSRWFLCTWSGLLHNSIADAKSCEMTTWGLGWASCGLHLLESMQKPAGPQTAVMQNAAVVAAAIANGGVVMVSDRSLARGAVVSQRHQKSLWTGGVCGYHATQVRAMLGVVESGAGMGVAFRVSRLPGKAGTADVENGNLTRSSSVLRLTTTQPLLFLLSSKTWRNV